MNVFYRDPLHIEGDVFGNWIRRTLTTDSMLPPDARRVFISVFLFTSLQESRNICFYPRGIPAKSASTPRDPTTSVGFHLRGVLAEYAMFRCHPHSLADL